MEAVLGKIATTIKSKLHGLKAKAREKGMQKIMQYKDKIPTEDQVMEKVKTTGCSPADKKRLEAKYNKLKNTLNKIKGILGKAAAGVAALSALLAMLNGLISILDAIISILNVILKVLKIVIKIAKIVVKFLGGTGTGGFIDLLSRLISKAEYNIKKWVQCVSRAKEFIKKMLKKYINPIAKLLAKIAAALAALLGLLEGIIGILEMLYMFALISCAQSSENNSGSDDNNKGDGTAGDGSGGKGSGNDQTGLGLNNISNDKGATLEKLSGLLDIMSPEEILAKYVNTGDDEFIRYIRNANFETIGYERFNAALNSEDTTAGADYPLDSTKQHLEMNTTDPDNDILEFPDLERGNKKSNILLDNLRLNPKGPKPSN